jgi:hypothetical protein
VTEEAHRQKRRARAALPRDERDREGGARRRESEGARRREARAVALDDTFSSATSAPARSTLPKASKRPRCAARAVGSVRIPSTRPAMQNGTVSRKIERQPNASSSRPPIAGPIAGASTIPKPYTPIARPRCSTG